MNASYVRNEFPTFLEINEPSLAFGDRDNNKGRSISAHPLKGLVTYGPFSYAQLAGFMDAVRIALIAPTDNANVAQRVVTELRSRWQPGERLDYVVNYPGVHSVFGTDVALADPTTTVLLSPDLDDQLAKASNRRQTLAHALSGAVADIARRSSEYDVVLIRLPERWRPWFTGDDDFDLRRYMKAAAAARGISTQIITDNALGYKDRCSVAWRLAIALYTKAGGIPWKLAESDPRTAYLGIGYALRSSGGNRFVRCCAQVFDADGVGLEFVGFSAADKEVAKIIDDDPFLTRPQMHAVISRSLALYQRQHAGRLPRRLVVHKTTHFATQESEGAFDAAGGVNEVELLRLQQHTPWLAVRGTSQGKPDSWPAHRGTVVRLSDTDLLVWTQGNAPVVAKRGNFYKEGRGIPHPLMVTRFAGHGPATEVASDVLALSKMNWNNDALYDEIPVTISYAKTLARVLTRLPSLSGPAYAFRLFM